MAARFQTVPCTSTRINIYLSTTSIPPVRFPFVIMQQSHNMSISPQTAVAFGSVGQLQILRLVSLSAPRAPLGHGGMGNALTNARIGMGSFTRQPFSTLGKMTLFKSHRGAWIPDQLQVQLAWGSYLCLARWLRRGLYHGTCEMPLNILKWLVVEWFTIFKRIHEVWMPRTLQDNICFWNVLLVRRRLKQFVRVPPYEILEFLMNISLPPPNRVKPIVDFQYALATTIILKNQRGLAVTYM